MMHMDKKDSLSFNNEALSCGVDTFFFYHEVTDLNGT